MSIRILTLFVLVIALPLAVGCSDETPEPTDTPPAPAEQATPSIINATWAYNVDGMHCEHCEQSVEKLIAELPGVNEVSASFTEKTVVISGDDAKMSRDKIADALGSFPGYTVEPADSAS